MDFGCRWLVTRDPNTFVDWMAPVRQGRKAPSFSISQHVTAGGTGYGPKKSYSAYRVLNTKIKDLKQSQAATAPVQSTSVPMHVSGLDSDEEYEDAPPDIEMDYVNAVVQGRERVDISHGGGEAELVAETLQKELYTL